MFINTKQNQPARLEKALWGLEIALPSRTCVVFENVLIWRMFLLNDITLSDWANCLDETVDLTGIDLSYSPRTYLPQGYTHMTLVELDHARSKEVAQNSGCS